MGARFGTVNSICGQIVGEHAIDLGRSPRAEIIPEDGVARLFAMLESGAVRAEIGQRYRLEGAADVHRALEAGETVGATILLP